MQLTPLTEEQEEAHRDITQSLQQCEIWLMGEVDVEIARTHLLDALDELHYEFNLLDI
jgi:hypothetical protein